jgi:small subunit ribosomal protein S10
MPQVARIKLVSTEIRDLEEVCRQIKEMGEKLGVRVKGPIPLPTKKLKVVTRKSPSGQGTETFDRWELRIYRRVIDIDANERTMAQLTRIRIPSTVNIELRLRTV